MSNCSGFKCFLFNLFNCSSLTYLPRHKHLFSHRASCLTICQIFIVTIINIHINIYMIKLTTSFRIALFPFLLLFCLPTHSLVFHKSQSIKVALNYVPLQLEFWHFVFLIIFIWRFWVFNIHVSYIFYYLFNFKMFRISHYLFLIHYN